MQVARADFKTRLVLDFDRIVVGGVGREQNLDGRGVTTRTDGDRGAVEGLKVEIENAHAARLRGWGNDGKGGVQLLIGFERSGQAEPDDRVAAGLKIEPVPGARRMRQQKGDVAAVPVGQVGVFEPVVDLRLGSLAKRPVLTVIITDEITSAKTGEDFAQPLPAVEQKYL